MQRRVGLLHNETPRFIWVPESQGTKQGREPRDCTPQGAVGAKQADGKGGTEELQTKRVHRAFSRQLWCSLPGLMHMPSWAGTAYCAPRLGVPTPAACSSVCGSTEQNKKPPGKSHAAQPARRSTCSQQRLIQFTVVDYRVQRPPRVCEGVGLRCSCSCCVQVGSLSADLFLPRLAHLHTLTALSANYFCPRPNRFSSGPFPTGSPHQPFESLRCQPEQLERNPNPQNLATIFPRSNFLG